MRDHPRGITTTSFGRPVSSCADRIFAACPVALVGISMIFSGISRLMLSLAARRVMDKLA
jgi:hypothetical protein